MFEQAASGQAIRNKARLPAPESPSNLPPVSHVLMSRYNREKLYEGAWSQPMQRLAKMYGVSDVALAQDMQEAQDTCARQGLLGQEGSWEACA